MKTLLPILLFIVSSLATAGDEYQTVNGDTVTIPQQGAVHLVFIDIWGSYGGSGPEAAIEALPDTFHNAVSTLWIQPRMNVTDAQAREYQKAFPASTPLIMDDYLEIMRRYSIKATPAHVLLRDGKVIFSGGTEAFLSYLGHPLESGADAQAEGNEGESAQEAEDSGAPLPSVEDVADLDQLLISSSDTANLIFLSALCPMPHFPQCEPVVASLSQTYRADEHNWFVIYNSFYSTPSSAKAFSEKHSLTMPALFDEEQTLYKRYQIYSTPYLIQLNRKGKVLYRGNDFSRLTDSAPQKEQR